MFEVCSQHLIIFQSTPKILFIYLFSWRTIPYQSFHNNPISDLVNNQLQIYYIIFWGVHHQKVILSSLSFPLSKKQAGRGGARL